VIRETDKRGRCWDSRVQPILRLHRHLDRGNSLKDGDLLISEEGLVALVKAAPEPVSTVLCRDPLLLARACYHPGNRHVPLQIEQGRLCYLHDHVLDALDLPLLVRMHCAAHSRDPDAMTRWIDWLVAARETSELRSEEAYRGRALADLLIASELTGTLDWKPVLARSQTAGFAFAAASWDIPLDLIFIESGGDNLAATFSPELADLTIYVIGVAEGEKIPRKGGPGITRSDLLVINKIDLAPHVGASLEVMEQDSKRMRGDRPFVFTNLGLRRDRCRGSRPRRKISRAKIASGWRQWHPSAEESDPAAFEGSNRPSMIQHRHQLSRIFLVIATPRGHSNNHRIPSYLLGNMDYNRNTGLSV